MIRPLPYIPYKLIRDHEYMNRIASCLLFSGFSNVYHFACVWPTALKLGCITNFDMLFHVIGFISLVDEIQFMLFSSRHICIKSLSKYFWTANTEEQEI